MSDIRNYEEYRRQVLESLGEDYTVEDLRNFERWRLKVLHGLGGGGKVAQAIGVTNSASGSIASFTDGGDDLPMKSLKVEIVPKQSGSGDPSPDNVRPISGWDEVEVVRTGKNLFNKNATNTANGYAQGKWLRGSNGAMANDSTSSVSEYIEMKPNTQYTVSGTYGTNPGVCFYDGNKTFISGQGYNTESTNPVYTFTTPSGTVYARFSIVNEMVDRIQLELGSTATAYEPYQGESYSIPFKDSQDNPITVYGGEIDVVSGEGTSTMAMVDLGSLSWERYTGTVSAFRASLNGTKIYQTLESPNLVSSQYIVGMTANSQSNVLATLPNNTMTMHSNYALIFIRDDRFDNASDFKTAMNGVQLCYELATPIEIQLTPTEVKTLKGNNNVWADTGDTSVEYLADTKLYIDNKFNELQALVLENIGE